MPSATEVSQEENRKRVTGDNRYASKGRYLFILRGPASKGPFKDGQTEIRFPLVINPNDFEYVLPFAVELTGLQEGGVTAEEGGIVIGEITIVGTTGFKLRPDGGTSTKAVDGGFTSDLSAGTQVQSSPTSFPLSGHMHFWRLANRCFDGYSQLKKDPATAAQTSMAFHSFKDDLAVTVVPREFRLTRGADRERVTYRYAIRLAVVGPDGHALGGRVGAGSALRPGQIASPDRKMLDLAKNAIPKLRSVALRMRASINDLTASLDEIRRVITSAANVLDDATRLVTAVESLVNGVDDFFGLPKVFIAS
ncbi:MAG: hypothetical protein ACREO9_03685, partial [Lysobacterales bacterium]